MQTQPAIRRDAPLRRRAAGLRSFQRARVWAPFRGLPGAFTLIELLIVVAIIAILAAIAVPNFMEAQVRAKVSRVKNDMRALRTALESYAVDYGRHPSDHGDDQDARVWALLTTPVAYMSSILANPFIAENFSGGLGHPELNVYVYGADERWLDGVVHGWAENVRAVGLLWWVLSAGPDRWANLRDYPGWGDGEVWVELDAGRNYLHVLYDSTNGTRSLGDIIASNKRLYN